jgi:hypothetical protein
MDDLVASRTLICVRPSGDAVKVTMELGKPYAADNSAFCPVRLEPFSHRVVDIGGVDSWQAIHLAMRHVHALIADERDRGSRFYWPDENGKPEDECLDLDL